MIVLATGAGGQVGHALARVAAARGIHCIALGREQLDITDAASIRAAFDAVPELDVVINLAAYTHVDAAESEPDAAFRVNAGGVETLGLACARVGRPLLHVSTDYVFDGTARHAYRESDAVHPVNVYGRSKAAGEDALRSVLDRHVIVRTSWVFGVTGANFVLTMLRLAREHDELRVVADEIGCPTGADDLAGALLSVAERMADPGFTDWGTCHFCGRPAVSRAQYARAIFAAADRAGLPSARVQDIPGSEFPTPAKRPPHAILECAAIGRVFGIVQPDWRPALERTVRTLAAAERSRVRR